MKNTRNINWFTLVEMLVAMTIFWIVIISVMMIYATSTQISIKTDINREMQQNIKSTIETIAEDVRKNWIVWVSTNPNLPIDKFEKSKTWSVLKSKSWTRLKTNSFHYTLFWYEASNWQTVSDASPKDNTFCNNIKNICFIMKCENNDIDQDSCWASYQIWPLSNSKTSISNFSFYTTDWEISKVTINFTAKPSIKKWLKSKFIENSKLIFQTTISERYLKVK